MQKRGRSGTRSDLAELAFFVYFFWQLQKSKSSSRPLDLHFQKIIHITIIIMY